MLCLWAVLWSVGIFERRYAAEDFGSHYCPKHFRGHGSKLMDNPSMLPNQARYQLRYTRIQLSIIIESKGDCKAFLAVVQCP